MVFPPLDRWTGSIVPIGKGRLAGTEVLQVSPCSEEGERRVAPRKIRGKPRSARGFVSRETYTSAAKCYRSGARVLQLRMSDCTIAEPSADDEWMRFGGEGFSPPARPGCARRTAPRRDANRR